MTYSYIFKIMNIYTKFIKNKKNDNQLYISNQVSAV
jgi:hypothetical protein